MCAATASAAAAASRARSAGSPPRRDSAPARRADVAGRDDEPGDAVADEAAGGRADGVGGQDGRALVHGLVDHQPPGLAEGARRQRRHHENVGRGQDVAHDGRRLGPERHLAGEARPRRAVGGAEADERRRRAHPGRSRARPRAAPRRPSRGSRARRRPPGASRSGRAAGRPAPTRTPRRRPAARRRRPGPPGPARGADVLAVGHDDVGVAHDRRAAAVRRGRAPACAPAPTGRPEQERRAGAAGPAPGGRQGDAPGRPGDDRAVAPAGGEVEDVALPHPAVGDARVRQPCGRVVRAAAEERELDALPRVQGREGAPRGRAARGS